MKHKSLALLIALIPCITHTSEHHELAIEKPYIHIADFDTTIIFRKEQKSIYDFIEQERRSYFGNTIVVNKISETPFFKKTGTIRNMDPNDLLQMYAGNAIYCYHIKQMHDGSEFNTDGSKPNSYGAIICCSQQENDAWKSNDTFFQNIIKLFKLWFLQKLYEKDKKKKLTNNKNIT